MSSVSKSIFWIVCMFMAIVFELVCFDHYCSIWFIYAKYNDQNYLHMWYAFKFIKVVPIKKKEGLLALYS